MFNLIYLILGIYLIKILVIKINMEHKKKNGVERILLKKYFESKIKNIFVFRNNGNNYKENSNISNKEEWNLKRYTALEKAKYKCEECGNITNLQVYTKEINNDEELIVLCKMCYEKNIGEIKLRYQ